jgi:hypothetical protein
MALDAIGFNSEWKIGDVIAGLYLLATGLIFIWTIKAVKVSSRAHHESTFFHMLELLREVVDRLSHGQRTGAAVLEEVVSNLRGRWEGLHGKRDQATGKGVMPEETAVLEMLAGFFTTWEQFTGHYFHTLYRVLKYVHEHKDMDRRWYAKTLRSQLPTDEVVLLFWYGLSPGGGKLKLLIEEYGMLEDIEDRHLFDSRARGQYKQSAFNAR